jgi:hypothetical protein
LWYSFDARRLTDRSALPVSFLSAALLFRQFGRARVYQEGAHKLTLKPASTWSSAQQ